MACIFAQAMEAIIYFLRFAAVRCFRIWRRRLEDRDYSPVDCAGALRF